MTFDLIRLSAREAARGLRAGALDPAELVEAALARVEAIDGRLNAVPTRSPERARAAALRARAERVERALDPAWLGGLPIVIKDTHAVAGVRTTFGSAVFADHIPAVSGRHVERLERRGAIVIGKSNTPEFAAGGQTVNPVFGATRNPWNLERTCGGSSGGAAVALATGMAWLADGSDFGGSLRIPAAFCGVVGLRPSPGRVPQSPRAMPFQTLDVLGPMARDVRDLALMLDMLSGAEAADPLSLPDPPVAFASAVEQPSGVARVALCLDLGPNVPIDPEIAAIVAASLAKLDVSGIPVEDRALGVEEAIQAFATLRAVQFAAELGPMLAAHRDRLTRELATNIEAGGALGGHAVVAAEQARGRFLGEVLELFASFDILALPATIMPPFDLALRYPEAAGGQRFASYFSWAAPTFVISLTGCPALSLPCGLTASGLPVGVQLVAPPRAEGRLLAFARGLEDLLGFAHRLPIDPVASGRRLARDGPPRPLDEDQLNG